MAERFPLDIPSGGQVVVTPAHHLQAGLVFHQRPAHAVGDTGQRQVVGGGAEAAGAEHQVGLAFQGVGQRLPNRLDLVR